MKRLHPSLILTCALAATLLSALPSAAQDEAPDPNSYGFLEMVNLIALTEPSYFTFGGYKIAGGEPIETGDSSGYATIQANSYDFTASNAGANPSKVKGKIKIEDGKNSKIVFFDEAREKKDGETEHRIRFTILTESDSEEGARLTLVSLLNEEFSSATINGQSGPADGREPFLFPVKEGDEISIQAAGKKMDSFEIDDEIHFLCFLFEDPETGSPRLTVVRNENLEYHPPLEVEDDTADSKSEEPETAETDETGAE